MNQPRRCVDGRGAHAATAYVIDTQRPIPAATQERSDVRGGWAAFEIGNAFELGDECRLNAAGRRSGTERRLGNMERGENGHLFERRENIRLRRRRLEASIQADG